MKTEKKGLKCICLSTQCVHVATPHKVFTRSYNSTHTQSYLQPSLKIRDMRELACHMREQLFHYSQYFPLTAHLISFNPAKSIADNPQQGG